MHDRSIGIIILAAGKGTRMKSDNPKVLHQLNGRSMIRWVLDASVPLAGRNIVVVVGHQREKVQQEIVPEFDVHLAVQEQLLGTGDAVKASLPQIPPDVTTVIVLCGDVPLIRSKTLVRLLEHHRSNRHDITVLCVDVDEPYGYGRLLLSDTGQLLGVREEADATEDEKLIKTINSGIYCIEMGFLEKALALIKADNVQQEYYLTDVVGIATQLCSRSGFFRGTDPREVIGVNTIAELKKAEEYISSSVT